MENLERFEIKCTSRGFHVYRTHWKPKLGQDLQVQHEEGNVHDPFAMAFKLKTQATLTPAVVGHISREISHFCRYFMDYGGLLEARVRDTKCHISPIPNRGLEIPVTLVVKKGASSGEVFLKMKNYLEEHYIEPELIVKKKEDSDSETSDNEYVPAEHTTNSAPAEQEKEKEKEEEKKESDIVVIDD